jgi:hypothetical protein
VLLRTLVQTVLELGSDMRILGLLSLAVRVDVNLSGGGGLALLLLAGHLDGDLVRTASVGGLLTVEVEGTLGEHGLLGVSGSSGGVELTSLLGAVDEGVALLLLGFRQIGLELALGKGR